VSVCVTVGTTRSVAICQSFACTPFPVTYTSEQSRFGQHLARAKPSERPARSYSRTPRMKLCSSKRTHTSPATHRTTNARIEGHSNRWQNALTNELGRNGAGQVPTLLETRQGATGFAAGSVAVCQLLIPLLAQQSLRA